MSTPEHVILIHLSSNDARILYELIGSYLLGNDNIYGWLEISSNEPMKLTVHDGAKLTVHYGE